MLDMRSKQRFLRALPIGSRHGAKIDNQEPPKAAKDKVRRFFRGSFRVTDTIKMLENRDALTRLEKRWLLDLKQNDKAAYKALGNLLTVPKYLGGSGQYGVSHREDRNKVRMQTLKAAVFEAAKTAESDNIGTVGEIQQKKQWAVERALTEATKVRYRLNRNTSGEKLRIYKLVTPETLRDPMPFHEKSERMVSNRELASFLDWRCDLLDDITDLHLVVGAVQALIDNDLLDSDAAKRLLFMLVNRPEQINDLMAITENIEYDEVAVEKEEADRQKVRSLLLLSLAYTTHKNALDKGAELCAEVYVKEPSDSRGIGRDSQKYDAGDWALRQAHELLPDLPPNDIAPTKDSEKWIEWAKQYAKPRTKAFFKYNNRGDVDPIIRAKENKKLADELPRLLGGNPLYTHEKRQYRIADKDKVVSAVRPLLNNNLIDPVTAMRLMDRLNAPDMKEGAAIRYITSVTADRDLKEPESQKAGSLLYLGFAYMTSENFDYFRDRAKDDFDVNPSGSDSRAVLQVPKHTYKSLPDLPASGNVDDDTSKAWFSWWEKGLDPFENDLNLHDGLGLSNNNKANQEDKLDLPQDEPLKDRGKAAGTGQARRQQTHHLGKIGDKSKVEEERSRKRPGGGDE